MITIKSITSYEEFKRLQSVWNPLLEKTSSNCIFLTWEWLTTWWDVFGKDKELLILLGYEGSELAGIAPLMRNKVSILGIQLRSIGFIGSGNESLPDHLNIFAIEAYRNDFLGKVFERLITEPGRWDILKFRDMTLDEGFIDSLSSAVKGKYNINVIKSPENISPYLVLPKSWDEYLASLSPETRYSIRRKERNISKNFTIEFTILNDKAQMEPVFETLEELHKKRMADKSETGSSMESPFWLFHRKAADIFLENGWLLLGMLKADNKIIAVQYSFQYNRKACYYQSGIDTSFHKYGAGAALIGNMIKESIKRGLSEYDFLRGNESYKSHWAKQFRQSAEIIVWNSSPAILIIRLLFNLKSFIKQKVFYLNHDNCGSI